MGLVLRTEIGMQASFTHSMLRMRKLYGSPGIALRWCACRKRPGALLICAMRASQYTVGCLAYGVGPCMCLRACQVQPVVFYSSLIRGCWDVIVIVSAVRAGCYGALGSAGVISAIEDVRSWGGVWAGGA